MFTFSIMLHPTLLQLVLLLSSAASSLAAGPYPGHRPKRRDEATYDFVIAGGTRFSVCVDPN
jgi:hypothetical protein